MSKVGITELRQLFMAAITMGNACGLAFEDKKIGLGDIHHLMAFIGAAKDLATDVDFKLALPEFKDLDEDEMSELMEIVEENFDLPEEMVEEKVKQIFGLALRLYGVVSEAIAMVQHPETMG
jgi:hypothetical protein